MAELFKLEGLTETVQAMEQLSKSLQRGVLQRVLRQAAEPVADVATRLAPERTGLLAFSIAVSPSLTRSQRREGKGSWVEMHIGPAAGSGALYYASFVEFGTVDTRPEPYMRPAWESQKMTALNIITTRLGEEVTKSAQRAARRAARFA